VKIGVYKNDKQYNVWILSWNTVYIHHNLCFPEISCCWNHTMAIKAKGWLLFRNLTWRLKHIHLRLAHNGQIDGGNFGEGEDEVERLDKVAKKWSERFESADILEPEHSANLIIAHVLGKKMVSTGFIYIYSILISLKSCTTITRKLRILQELMKT